MRIVESRATALTIRYPRPAPKAAPAIVSAIPRAAPVTRPSTDPTRRATPDPAFVMQLIATAAPAKADLPAADVVSIAYGGVDRAPPPSGDRIARST